MSHTDLGLIWHISQELLKQNPNPTTVEIRTRIENITRQDYINAGVYMDECIKCRREIILSAGRWTHLGADGLLWRGCRAASYNSENGWDDTINRNWNATAQS